MRCGKFEFNALVDREPMKMLKNGAWMGASNNSIESILDALKPANVFLCSNRRKLSIRRD